MADENKGKRYREPGMTEVLRRAPNPYSNNKEKDLNSTVSNRRPRATAKSLSDKALITQTNTQLEESVTAMNRRAELEKELDKNKELEKELQKELDIEKKLKAELNKNNSLFNDQLTNPIQSQVDVNKKTLSFIENMKKESKENDTSNKFPLEDRIKNKADFKNNDPKIVAERMKYVFYVLVALVIINAFNNTLNISKVSKNVINSYSVTSNLSKNISEVQEYTDDIFEKINIIATRNYELPQGELSVLQQEIRQLEDSMAVTFLSMENNINSLSNNTELERELSNLKDNFEQWSSTRLEFTNFTLIPVEQNNLFLDESAEVVTEEVATEETVAEEVVAETPVILSELSSSSSQTYVENITSIINNLKDTNELQLSLELANNSNYIKNSWLWTVILSLLFASTVFLLLKRVYLTTIPPIEKVRITAQEISEGQIHVPLKNIDRDDEIGDLANSLNETSIYLRNCVGEISEVLKHISNNDTRTNALNEYKGEPEQIKISLETIIITINGMLHEVISSSDMMTDTLITMEKTSQELMDIVSSQLAETEILNENIEKATAQAQENINSAENIHQLSKTIQTSANLGTHEMNHVILALEDLSSVSNKINSMLSTIDNIAFQTNVIALNSAIESARVGSAGQGFKTVAEDIRRLAVISGEASEQTRKLIDDSIRSISESNTAVDKTSETFKKISGDLENSINLSKDLYEATTIQNNLIAEINNFSDKIHKITEEPKITSSNHLYDDDNQTKVLEKFLGTLKSKSEEIKGKKSFITKINTKNKLEEEDDEDDDYNDYEKDEDYNYDEDISNEDTEDTEKKEEV